MAINRTQLPRYGLYPIYSVVPATDVNDENDRPSTMSFFEIARRLDSDIDIGGLSGVERLILCCVRRDLEGTAQLAVNWLMNQIAAGLAVANLEVPSMERRKFLEIGRIE